MSNRCLAHIINLATQALISTHSKSHHYNPADPEADLSSDDIGRDTVELVRAICVKVSVPYSAWTAPNNSNQGMFICQVETVIHKYSIT